MGASLKKINRPVKNFFFSKKGGFLVIKRLFLSLGISGLIFFLVLNFVPKDVLAWTEPSASPPGGNVAAPLNTSGTGQTKTGGLNILGNIGVRTPSPYGALEVTPENKSWGEGVVINPSPVGYSAVFLRKEGTSGSTKDGSWALGKNAALPPEGWNGGELFQITREGLLGGSLYRVDAPFQIKTTGESLFGFNVGIGNTMPGARLTIGNNLAHPDPDGSSGDAIYAYTNSANAAISAEQGGSGWAGYFSGKVFASQICLGGETDCTTSWGSGIITPNIILVPKNLVTNGGMEGDYSAGVAPGWTTQAITSATASPDSHTGVNAQKISTNKPEEGAYSDSSLYQDLTSIVSTTKKYRLSFWAKGTSGPSGHEANNFRVKIAVDRNLGNNPNGLDETISLSNSYQRYSFPFTIMDGSVNSWLHFGAFYFSFDVLIDDISLIEVDSAGNPILTNPAFTVTTDGRVGIGNKGSQELIANGVMEGVYSGGVASLWAKGNSITAMSSSDSHTRAQAQEISIPNSHGEDTFYQDRSSLIFSGKKYILSFWAKDKSGSSDNLRVKIAGGNNFGNSSNGLDESIDLSNGYKRYSYQFTAGAGNSWLLFGAYYGESLDILIDDISLVEVGAGTEDLKTQFDISNKYQIHTKEWANVDVGSGQDAYLPLGSYGYGDSLSIDVQDSGCNGGGNINYYIPGAYNDGGSKSWAVYTFGDNRGYPGLNNKFSFYYKSEGSSPQELPSRTYLYLKVNSFGACEGPTNQHTIKVAVKANGQYLPDDNLISGNDPISGGDSRLNVLNLMLRYTSVVENAAGNVGIGTNPDVGGRLEVAGGNEPLVVRNNDYYFFAGANRNGGDYVDIGAFNRGGGGSWKNLVINRDGLGNVGIGTTTPGARLTVSSPNKPAGSSTDTIFAYADSGGTAISTQQNDPNGWAGYFSGDVNITNPTLTSELCLNGVCKTAWPVGGGASLWKQNPTSISPNVDNSNVSIGGAGISAPFYFDVGSKTLRLGGQLQFAQGPDQLKLSITGDSELYLADRAGKCNRNGACEPPLENPQTCPQDCLIVEPAFNPKNPVDNLISQAQAASFIPEAQAASGDPDKIIIESGNIRINNSLNHSIRLMNTESGGSAHADFDFGNRGYGVRLSAGTAADIQSWPNDSGGKPLFIQNINQNTYINAQNGGQVAIGTDTPDSGGAKLTVNTALNNYGLVHVAGGIKLGTYIGGTPAGAWFGTTTSNPLYFFTNNHVTPDLTIDTAGKVGIGMSDPAIKLAIGDNDTGLNWAGDGALDLYANNVNMLRIRSGNVEISGSIQRPLAPAGSDYLIYMTGGGFGNNGLYWDIQQATLNLNTNNTPRLSISAQGSTMGNIGIGLNAVTIPEKLTIYSPANTNAFIRVSSPDNYVSGIKFGEDQADTQTWGHRIIYDGNGDYVKFQNIRNQAANDVMTFDSAGNVGIGTIKPSNKLSVTPAQYSTGTASQSGTTVTGVGGATFTSAMVGSQLVFANGVSAGTITAFTNPTTLTVSTNQTVAVQSYNIAYTGLQVGVGGKVGIGILPFLTSPSLTVSTNPSKTGSLGDTIYAYANSTSAAISAEQGGFFGYNYGVYSKATNSSTGTGVYGEGYLYGLRGVTTGNGVGVYGEGGGNIGVQGVSNAINGRGVYGVVGATGGIGVYGKTTANSGTNNYGVYGEAVNDKGWAGYFTGDVRVGRTLEVAGDLKAEANSWGTSDITYRAGPEFNINTGGLWGVASQDWHIECPDGYYMIGIGQEEFSTDWWKPVARCAKL